MTGAEQIQQLIGELDAVEREASVMFLRNNAAALEKRPAQGGWSVAECIQHLTATSHLYLGILPKEIERARASGKTGSGPFRMDFTGKVLKWFLEPPYRMKAKTIPAADVDGPGSADLIFKEFFTSQESLRQLYASAAGINLSAVTIVSPFGGKVKYNLYSCFALINAHQRRHLYQASRVLEG